MNNKILVGGVVVVVALIAVVIFLTKGSSTPQTPSETTTQPTPAAVKQKEEATSDATMEEKDAFMKESQVKEFSVTGSPFKMVPNTLAVKKGDTVKVTFKNAQGIHDFTIDEFDVKTKQLQAGEQEVVQFVADKAGSYEYYCSVGNHRAQGMEGTLIVE